MSEEAAITAAESRWHSLGKAESGNAMQQEGMGKGGGGSLEQESLRSKVGCERVKPVLRRGGQWE